ncbi:MAG TPA: ATP12 family protein [Rhizomicrobium sp.]|jgi:chaperone required for assembly of F1-ATPase|nr:ATP12 family protein [Rhizomicrobium sp.]
MKRFYKSVSVQRQGGLFAVTLDGRPIKTPGGELMALRSERLADAIAAEWAAQDTEIDLDTMHLTKLAQASIDGVPYRAAIAGRVLAFGRTDLVCYRAPEPPALAERQAASWDMPLAWVRGRYHADLVVTTGLVHVPQPASAVASLEQVISARDQYALTGLDAATGILGSLVLALAMADGKLTAADAFAASQVDESFQSEKWGRDPEAEKRLTRLEASLEAAERFLRLL